jgi:hypothetical protein
LKDIREVNSNREINKMDLSNERGWYRIGYGEGKGIGLDTHINIKKGEGIYMGMGKGIILRKILI